MLQYTRREVLDMLLDFVGENDDVNARNTAERLLNIALQNLWSKMAWQVFDMPAPWTFQTVPGQPSYPMPGYFGRIRDGIIRNITTGGKILPTTLTSLQQRIPEFGTQFDTTGMPQFYAIGGTVGLERQVVPTGEVVSAQSDATTDTNVRMGVAGLDPNGRLRRAQVTLNGTSPTALGTWFKVLELSKAFPADTQPTTELTSSNGTVTVSGSVSGPLLELAPYESATEHVELTLWPTPNVVQWMSVPMSRAPQRLLYDSDLLPLGWGPAMLETMDLLWKVNTGELKAMPSDAQRSMLQDLIALENGNRYAIPSRTRPYLG